MKFKISNIERPFFGLEPVLDHWEELIIPPGKYDENSVMVYFDGNRLVKEIISKDDFYYENELNIDTENRQYLLPRTSKGKKSKLTQANITNKYTATGMYFSAGSNGVILANYSTQTNFYSTSFEQISINSYKEFEDWKSKYIKHSTSDYLDQINKYKFAKRTRIKYRKRDYFSIKINRELYGFGRILEDIGKLNKEYELPKNSYLRCFMGPKLLICFYGIKHNKDIIPVDQLKESIQLPSEFIKDNRFLYGEYNIFNNQEVTKSEIDYPISLSFYSDGRFELQWGEIFITWTDDEQLNQNVLKFRKTYKEFGSLNFNKKFTNFDPNFNLKILNKVITEKKSDSLFDQQDQKEYSDLRNPKYELIKTELFNVFNLNPKKGYIENLDSFKTTYNN